MKQAAALQANPAAVRRNKVKTFFSKPHNVILLLMGIVLTITTVAPIIAIVQDTFKIHPGTIDAYLAGTSQGYTLVNYTDLFTSPLAKANLWTPPAEYRSAFGRLLHRGHSVRRCVCVPHYAHQSFLPQILKLHLYLSLHHAPVDPGGGVAEPF